MTLEETLVPGRMRRLRHGIVDSTNERAFAALQEGTAQHGDVHLAVGQTSGRGRQGRTWWSEPGAGLYCSVVLLPGAPYSPPALTMAGGMGALDTVRALGAVRARLKWPNDVVVHDAKLAGILAETRGLDPKRPAYVLGIGINVSQTSFPAELLAERDATSLRLRGSQASVQDTEDLLLQYLSLRVDQLQHDPLRLETDFLVGLALRGEEVRASTSQEEVEGRLLGLSLEGGLHLATLYGERRLPLEWVRSLG